MPWLRPSLFSTMTGNTMNKQAVAQELVAVAKLLSAGFRKDYPKGTKFRVLTKLTLGFDSTIHAPVPSKYKSYTIGDILTFQSDAPNGKVWFTDDKGLKGMTEAGEVENLVDNGTIKEV